MAQPWTFIQAFPHLTVIGKHKASKSLQLSLFPENSASWPGMPILTPWKPSWSPENTEPMPFQWHHGGASPPGGTWWKSWCRWGITFKLFKLLSQFLPVLKKKKKKISSKVLVTCSCFSSLVTLYSKILSQQSLMLNILHICFSSGVAG